MLGSAGKVRARRPRSGFTLIEVMIVVAVLAILAAIAIPGYQEYVLRSKRAAARQVLMEAAQFLERNYTASGCYDKTSTTDCIGRTGADLVPPAGLERAPSEGRQSYRVVWDFRAGGPRPGQEYELRAVPCGDTACLAGSEASFKDPNCGTLTIRETGLRGATGDVAVCWQR